MLKDCLGQTLGILDRVITQSRHYRSLAEGEVIGFTKEKIKIKYITTQNNLQSPGDVVLKDPCQVCLIITRDHLDDVEEAAYERGFDTGRYSAPNYETD